MAAFSSAQFTIENVIGMYLRRRIPDLEPVLGKQFLSRIRDDQSLPLFKAFAAQANYDGDLTHFETIYRRAMQLSDMIGHSLNVVGPVYSTGKLPLRGRRTCIDGKG